MSLAAQAVWIDAGQATLEGSLHLPPAAAGVVLFAHGSGSGRHSPRNMLVAGALHQAGLATLLVDLLTPAEQAIDQALPAANSWQKSSFNIALLAARLAAALDWLGRHSATTALPVGLFGASTGAAAALQVAARRPAAVAALVARGGRPDLAGSASLADVKAPTLLVVGGADHAVLALNRQALAALHCVKRLEIIAGATHLFAEPGALEAVAQLAAQWYGRYLNAAPPAGERPSSTGTASPP